MNTIVRVKLLGLTFALIAALCAAIRIEASRLERQKQRSAELALQVSNAIAERDSTHNVAQEHEAVAKLLGDSLRLVEKQVVQIAQQADALDHAMDRERVAKYGLSVTLDSLRRLVILSPSTSLRVNSAKDPALGDDVRRATFAMRKEPFTVSGQVDFPSPPEPATLAMTVAVDPFDLEARISCSPPDPDGARRAVLTTSSPQWAHVRFNRLEQSPDVCRATRVRVLALGRRRLQFVPVIGIGTAIGPRGRLTFGLIFGSAILISG